MISDDFQATELLGNNAMLFLLANTICQLHMLLFLLESNLRLLCIDVKPTHHVQVAWEIKHGSILHLVTIET